jgi:3-oxoacyl-[acyl-carrier protein] reductase
MSQNKVVLVTGASRGIGAAIAYEFARDGYDVVINYLKSEGEGETIKNKIIQDFGVKALTIKADISKESEIKDMVKNIFTEFGKIDVLVNNAGIAIDAPVEDKKIEEFEKILKVNLIGQFICARECVTIMDKGSIINRSSTNGIDTYYPYSLEYDASKSGVISLTKNLAVEYALKGIRVNAIAPGRVMTNMNAELDVDYIEQETKKILLGRFATPEEIATVAVFLASNKASYINGEVIKVDGGH